jgi:hypothetical protein
MRRRHNVIMFALVLLLALTVCQVSAWSAWKPKHLPGFHVKKKLPKTMVAGSTYEMTVDFRNPKRENFAMNVTLEITEEQFNVGLGEFSVTGTLYAWETPPPEKYCDNLTFKEDKAGIFSNTTVIVHGKTHNCLTLRISSVPNLMPDTYTFTLTVTLQY